MLWSWEKNGNRRFNKVNGTKNIYAIGDTAIQNSDAAFILVASSYQHELI
jgi:hypothetical protein